MMATSEPEPRFYCLSTLTICLLVLAPGVANAAPIDFTTFEVDHFPQTNGPLAIWVTTPNEARIDDRSVDDGGSPNASVNVFHGPINPINKRFVGTLTPGTDDDYIGFVLGFRPGDADILNFPAFVDADYLLIDWKGLAQTFTFNDSPESGLFFHSQTTGGDAPVGLALSRVTGIPTADELWQHVDSFDNFDGGVEELARGATLGSTPHPRDDSSVVFDIRYSPSNITVLVDGVEQFNLDGSFPDDPDGRFGLYSLNQGPSAIWSDFEVFELFEPMAATVDRDTGEVLLTNPSGSAVDFAGYSVLSPAGGLNPDDWSPIAGNLDSGGPDSIDSDPWTITTSGVFELGEAEETAGDGGTLDAGQTISLGSIWQKSPFEDLLIDLRSLGGDLIPVEIEYINGPDGMPFVRSDLNADGVIDAADWPLLYENTLTDLSEFSPVQQYLRGDLDGDGDNDVFDFAIFKSDFDAANGAGAFAAMVAGVPEPSSIAILLAAALSVWILRKRFVASAAAALVVAVIVGGPQHQAVAAPLDFTTFTIDNYPQASGFPIGDWDVTPTTATLTGATSNAGATILYGPDSALNTRIVGLLEAGTDDDMVGFVLGYSPGDADYFNPASADANFLLIDWKGLTQGFNWADVDPLDIELHDLTPGTTAPVGLALSRVTGMPTADELWGHIDHELNPGGGVEELARGATLGSTSYPRDNTPVVVDIRYSDSRLTVAVDGHVQFDEFGTFEDGRFGLYMQGQGPPATFSDFDMTPLDEVTDALTAIVHRDTGEIELTNPSGAAIEFDYYQLSSRSGSLNTSGWNSLSDQEFQAIGSGEGERWAEAGGSSPTDLAELYLLSASSMETGSVVSLGSAYNSSINGEDLLLTFRLADGSFGLGMVQYMGEPTDAGIPGDYNGNGTVEQGDLDLVLLNWGEDATPAPTGWINDLPSGVIDQSELDGVLLNWGNMSGAAAMSAAGVPEPATVMLLLILAATCIAARRR